MKKRTAITLVVYLVIVVFLSVFFLFYDGMGEDAKKIKDTGIRIVFENQEDFNKAWQTDGKIYAYGEIGGNIKLAEDMFAGLEYRGKDREKQIKKMLKAVPDSCIAVKIEAQEVKSESRVRDVEVHKDGKTTYEKEHKIHFYGESYSELYLGEDFTFYGVTIPAKKRTFEGDYSAWIDTGLPMMPVAGSHLFRAKYLPDKYMAWVELDVVNGKIDSDVKIHSDGSAFGYAAREASGNTDKLSIIIGVVIFMGILCGCTIAIQNKIWG